MFKFKTLHDVIKMSKSYAIIACQFIQTTYYATQCPQ